MSKEFKSIPRISSLIIAGASEIGAEKCVQRKRARGGRDDGTMSFVSFRMADIMDCLARPLDGKYRLLRRPPARAQRSGEHQSSHENTHKNGSYADAAATAAVDVFSIRRKVFR